MNSLYDIGIKFGTDKTAHNYLSEYENVLSNFRFDHIRFLEIGIYEGRSIKMWEEYFPNGIIYGADINEYKNFETDRIKTFLIDQEKEEDLMTLPDSLDFILDDGGHTMPQQQTTLNILFKHKLKKGGIFILEDLHTSIIKEESKWYQTPTNNTLKLLQDLNNKQISKDSNFFITEKDFYELLDCIHSIQILYTNGKYGITSIIRKKD